MNPVAPSTGCVWWIYCGRIAIAMGRAPGRPYLTSQRGSVLYPRDTAVRENCRTFAYRGRRDKCELSGDDADKRATEVVVPATTTTTLCGRRYCCRVYCFSAACQMSSCASGLRRLDGETTTALSARWLQQRRRRYRRTCKAIILPVRLDATNQRPRLRPTSCLNVIRSRRRPAQPLFSRPSSTPLSAPLDAIYNRRLAAHLSTPSDSEITRRKNNGR